MQIRELAQACAEVQDRLDDMSADERELRGISLLGGSLDLCLFLRGSFGEGLNGLRIATGPPARARILPEPIRHARSEWIEGETPRSVEDALQGCALIGVHAFPAEKRAALRFERGRAKRCELIAECFGPQGNWFLLDDEGVILASARRPQGARAVLVPGAQYQAPELPADVDRSPLELRLDPDWLSAQIERFVDHDARQAFEQRRRTLARSLRRERKGIDGRLRGIEERIRNEARADLIRREAELLLMQPEPSRRGMSQITVQDWFAEGAALEIQLDPKLDLKANAQKRFDRARKLAEGAAHSERELTETQQRSETLRALEEREARLTGPSDSNALSSLEQDAAKLGLRRPGGRSPSRKSHKQALRRAWRSFTSSSGLPLWVGRTNQDNDELVRKSRGHDVWMHVGEGLGGSHVLIRLPRGKTAPLDCLLEAAELALHFSKGRGRPLCEIIYTPAKWVRKVKGTAAGLVEVQRNKSLRLEHDPGRLQRVLATREED
jgi:predicted ribosome quality control (RQC) complex YloA/Tae2 family protein